MNQHMRSSFFLLNSMYFSRWSSLFSLSSLLLFFDVLEYHIYMNQYSSCKKWNYAIDSERQKIKQKTWKEKNEKEYTEVFKNSEATAHRGRMKWKKINKKRETRQKQIALAKP